MKLKIDKNQVYIYKCTNKSVSIYTYWTLFTTKSDDSAQNKNEDKNLWKMGTEQMESIRPATSWTDYYVLSS